MTTLTTKRDVWISTHQDTQDLGGLLKCYFYYCCFLCLLMNLDSDGCGGGRYMIFLEFNQEIDDVFRHLKTLFGTSRPCWLLALRTPLGKQKVSQTSTDSRVCGQTRLSTNLPLKIHLPSNQLVCILQPRLRVALTPACQGTREICFQTVGVLPLPASLSNSSLLHLASTDGNIATINHVTRLDIWFWVL